MPILVHQINPVDGRFLIAVIDRNRVALEQHIPLTTPDEEHTNIYDWKTIGEQFYFNMRSNTDLPLIRHLEPGQWKPPGYKRTMVAIMVTICAYNARTLEFESSVEDLLMQARRIKYIIGLAETRRRYSFNVVYDTGEEPFLGTCDSDSAASAFSSTRVCP
ncbi:unnamed protein product [Angiostrongylus costaricensis]|uniref:Cystatin domain-containing protein n=1 Tax=Angiostrongylus costaricensis TaxID=334426 RepID=A0A0R3Q118_ANGCS|nr:unnamed protein product [Angiostrongylus costaricensis]